MRVLRGMSAATCRAGGSSRCIESDTAPPKECAHASNPRLNVVLDRDLHKDLRLVAKRRGKSLSAVAADLLRGAIERDEDMMLARLADGREKSVKHCIATKMSGRSLRGHRRLRVGDWRLSIGWTAASSSFSWHSSIIAKASMTTDARRCLFAMSARMATTTSAAAASSEGMGEAAGRVVGEAGEGRAEDLAGAEGSGHQCDAPPWIVRGIAAAGLARRDQAERGEAHEGAAQA